MVTAPMTERYGKFMLGGLEHVHQELMERCVPLTVLMPQDGDNVGTAVMDWINERQPQMVVCDHSPLRHFRQWMENQTAPLLETAGIPLVHVDAHNVIPVWHTSPKREVMARTIRTKINKVVGSFLTDFPAFEGNSHLDKAKADRIVLPDFDTDTYANYLAWDDKVRAVEWAQPGTKNAMKQYTKFVEEGLRQFNDLRNDPNYRNVCSNLSPWINHGHVSFQRLALKTKALNKHANGTAAYIEEGLVRRELSDNYVYYTPDDYDELTGAAEWAQDSLELHSSDEREWVFSLEELEHGKTHDDLWNAAELQLKQEGKLHGFVS